MILYFLLEIALGLLLTLATIDAYCPAVESDIPDIQTYNSDLPYPRKAVRRELKRNKSIKRQIKKSKRKLPKVFALGRRKREIDVWNEDPTSRANRFLLKFLGFDSSRDTSIPVEEDLGPTIEISHDDFLALKEKHGQESEGKVLEISEEEFNTLAEKHGGGAFIEKHGNENEESVVEVTEEEFNALAKKHGGEIERTVEVVHVPISPVDGDWQNVPISEVGWEPVPIDDHDQWHSEQTDDQTGDFIGMHGQRPTEHSHKSWQTIPVGDETNVESDQEKWQIIEPDDHVQSNLLQPAVSVDWRTQSKKDHKTEWQTFEVDDPIQDNSVRPVESVDWQTSPKDGHENWQTVEVDDHSPNHSVHPVESVDWQTAPKDDNKSWQTVKVGDHSPHHSAHPVESVDWQSAPKDGHTNWQTVKVEDDFPNHSSQPVESVDWQTSPKDGHEKWQTVKTNVDWQTSTNDHKETRHTVKKEDDHISSNSVLPVESDDWENSPIFTDDTWSSSCSPTMRSFSFNSNVYYKNMECWVLPKFKKTVFMYADCRKATCSSSDETENGLSFTCVPTDIKTYDVWLYCGYLLPKLQKYKLKLPQYCECKDKTCFKK